MSSAFIKLKDFAVVLILSSFGGFIFHVLLMSAELYLFDFIGGVDSDQGFWEASFSGIFLPMLFSEVLFIGLIIYFWNRAHAAIARAHELALQEERREAQVRSAQQLMQLVAEHIASHNNTIQAAISFRKNQGRKVSERIDKASQQIGIVLRALSEISYVTPYLNDDHTNAPSPVEALEQKITEFKADVNSINASE
ncbi:MAG: hypothetical protein KDK39_02070 [Leptospiraceae bacterium]|nr:hypothetical protein [Leptospiraceae bacterium]